MEVENGETASAGGAMGEETSSGRSNLPQSLREAALRLSALPEAVVSEIEASDFLEAFPITTIVSILQEPELSAGDIQTVCSALNRVMTSKAGKDLVAQNLELLSAALESPEYQIRRLGVQLLGSTLPERQDSETASAIAGMLADTDVGVASTAEQALVQTAMRGGSCLALITSGGCGSTLVDLTGPGTRAEVRMRVLGLGSRVSALSAEAAAAVEEAGLLGSLVTELRDPSDLLACAAALEVLQEVVEAASGSRGGAAAITEVFGPHMEGLLRIPPSGLEIDPILVCQAFKVSGSLVASCAETGSRSPATDSFCQFFLQSAAQILSMRRVGDGELPEEVQEAAMEAIAAGGKGSLGAERVVQWQAADGSLVQLLALEAVGQKSGHGHDRVVAIHALGTLAGAERLGRASSAGSGEQYSGEAVLSRAAEELLRRAVQGSGASDEPSAAPSCSSWADVLWALLRQPFLELRVAAYRMGSALSVRGWAAADLCSNAELRAFLCSPRSEAGQQASQWRYAMLQSLLVGASQAQGGAAGGEGAPASNGGGAAAAAAQGVSPGAVEELMKAVDQGPYGTGRNGASREHIVATVPL